MRERENKNISMPNNSREQILRFSQIPRGLLSTTATATHAVMIIHVTDNVTVIVVAAVVVIVVAVVCSSGG